MSQEQCNLCGLCKTNCPVYQVTKRETDSPRGKMILIKENVLSKEFYQCLLCGACKIECPSEIDMSKEIKKARQKLVLTMQESEKNKKLIQNLRETGNIYGL